MTDYRRRIYSKYASCFQGSKQTFDVFAANKWGRAYDSYLKGWLPSKKDANILDIACGSGRLLHFLKTRGYTCITGIDISPEQVSLAKQVTENVIQGNIIEFLKTTKKKYDLIIGLDIIEHLQKDEILCLLGSINTVLKKNGRLVLQSPNGSSPFGTTVFFGDFTHETCFTPKSLQCLLNLYNFYKIESRETRPVPLSFISSIRYIIWQMIRLAMKLRNLVETGDGSNCILTRVFIVSGVKK